jgi:hypothetical protein
VQAGGALPARVEGWDNTESEHEEARADSSYRPGLYQFQQFSDRRVCHLPGSGPVRGGAQEARTTSEVESST